MQTVRGVRYLLVAALAAGTVGLAACGDDGDDSSSAVASAQSQAESIQSQIGEAQSQVESQASEIQSQVESQASEIQSQAGDVQSQVSEQVDSAQSQASEAVSSAVESAAGAGDPAAGKTVFTSAGCGSCHTLADAGATGAVGPNLDDLKPDAATVAAQVTTGGGGMPSFAGQLSPADIANVAAYVSSVAGQ